jgi:replicative DNA helicase
MKISKDLKEIWQAPELYKFLLEEEKKKNPRPPIKSGIPKLDNFIVEFLPGELTIISGKTGHGKTLLSTSMTANMCENDNIVLWFSFELGPLEFLKKSMDEHGNIPGFFLPYQLIPNDLKYVDFKIKECKKEYGLDACFIDHLHYLCDLADVKLNIEISRVMRWLKQAAIKHEIAIFLICHIHKLVDLQLKNIDNDNLKDSSSIAQEADNVLFIVRSKLNKAMLKITKNRRHGYRNEYIPLIKKGNYLFEEEADYGEKDD